MKLSVSLFTCTGKWKYDAEVSIPNSVPSWDVGNYLRANEIPMEGVTTTSMKWVREGGIIFIDGVVEAPRLVFDMSRMREQV